MTDFKWFLYWFLLCLINGVSLGIHAYLGNGGWTIFSSVMFIWCFVTARFWFGEWLRDK